MDRATFCRNLFQLALLCCSEFSSVKQRHWTGTEFAETLGKNHNWFIDWLHISLGPESRSKSKFNVFCTLAVSSSRRCYFCLQSLGISNIIFHWPSKKMVFCQISRRSKWDFEKSSSILGVFWALEKPTWKRHLFVLFNVDWFLSGCSIWICEIIVWFFLQHV